MKVSIVLPVYNVAPYLRQCLDSLVGQTLKNIEIIFICKRICTRIWYNKRK